MQIKQLKEMAASIKSAAKAKVNSNTNLHVQGDVIVNVNLTYNPDTKGEVDVAVEERKVNTVVDKVGYWPFEVILQQMDALLPSLGPSNADKLSDIRRNLRDVVHGDEEKSNYW